MSIEGAVADRKALAEALADILDRWVPISEDRFMVTLPVSKVTYDRWQAVLDEHGGGKS